MDLSDIYSKTPKGLRARASLIGGLSSHLMKVLTHVDGSSKAENILLKFDKLTPQQLSADLSRLEQEGYIRLATVSTAPDDSWALTINFEPMVVEEFQSEEELEAVAQAQKAQQARQLEQQQAEQLVKQQAEQEEKRLAEEQKAEKKLQKLREKEKAKAETKVKAQLEEEKQEQEIQEKQRQELERIALEAARKEAEAEAKLKAKQEAERVEQQQAAERAAKLAEEARLKAELKAREAAEQAEAEAEAAAKEDARREIERISRESEETQKKAEAEAKAKLEAELAAQQEAERKAQAEAEQAKIDAEAKALAEKSAREAAEQEKIRQEIAQAEAVAKAKLEAELAAQQEAERKEKAEAEQVRIEAAAKVEAEKSAREAAEQEKIRQETAEAEAAAKAKAAQDLKEQARLEIANVLRKAEEDRKKAVAQAREQKLEAKRQAKAEQEAQLQTERKAKEDAKQKKLNALAEEKAKAEAAEIARKNPLEEEREQADAAKLAADLLVKTDMQQQEATRQNKEIISQQKSEALRASLVAEEQASIAAKEQARLEMERIGREAELVRQKATAEQHVAEVKKGLPNIGKPNSSLPMLDDFDAAEAAEEAAFHEEEQAEEAVEKIQRTIATTTGAITTSANTTSEKATKPLAESAGRVEIRNAAIAEAAAMASVHGKALSFVSAKRIKQWLVSGSKAIFIYVPLLVLLMLVLLHFVNLSSLVKPIEQLATESVGEPVAIKKVHASLWPQPHLVLEQVVIGASGSINAIHVLPEAASFFEETKVVKSLVIEGLTIEQADFGRPLQWASNVSKAKNLKVEQINLKNLLLTIRDLQLESFDGKVVLTDEGALSAIDLVSSNNALSVMIAPQGGDYAITLQAANWALPINQKMMFSSLNAKAVASNNQINFYQINGELYGGNMTGQASIQWPDGVGSWESTGNFTLTDVNAEQLLNTHGSAVLIDGKLALEGSFSGKAREANKLTDAAILNANFDVRQGSIKGVELASAVINRGSHSLVGDSTDFDKLTGNINITQNQYQFAKLVLVSPQFNANGFININANQTLTGRVSADLAAQSRRLHANFAITGRGKDLKSQ